MRRRRRWNALGLGLLALAGAIFFSPYFFQGRIFLGADALYMHFPWLSYAFPNFRAHNTLITDPVNANYPGLYNQQLKTGWMSQWNPYIYAGVPACEVTSMSGHPGRFYPPKLLLHLLLPSPDAFMWLLYLHVVLMGAAMFAYLREIGTGWRGSLFGGVAYMFNGSAMVWLEFESVTYAAAFLPLLLLCMERFRGGRPLRWGLLGGLLFGFMLLTGQLQFVSYTGLMTGLYLLFLLLRARQAGGGAREMVNILAGFGLMVTCGFLIASVALLPAMELMRQSSRIARSFTFRSFFDTLGRVPFRYLVTLIFPDFFGSPPLGFNLIPRLPTQEYMNYNELCLYAGVPTLAAFLALCSATQNAASRFYLGMTALVTGMVTGTLLYYPFFLFFPGMNRANPTRVIFLLMFVVAVSAGLGVDRIDRLTPRRRAVFLALVGLLTAGALLVGLTAGSAASLRLFSRELLRMPDAPGLLAELGRLRAPGTGVIMKPLLLALASAAGFTALALLARRRAAALAFAAVLGLLAYDLMSFGRYYNSVVERKYVYPWTPSLDFLARQPGPFRVVMDGRGFLVNTLVPFGIQEVGGYSSFYPERTGLMMSYIEYGPRAFEGARFDRWVMFGNVRAPLLDLLNARYVLTPPGTPLPGPKYRLAYRGDIDIHENTAALPRAFVVHRAAVEADPRKALTLMDSPAFDPRGTVVLEKDPAPGFLAGVGEPQSVPRAEIRRYEPDRVEISAELSTGGWLVLTDTWYPGWRAEVDGREVPIERADCAFRALPLEAGRHEVVFRFVPASYRLGLLLSLGGLLVVAGGAAAGALRSRRAAKAPTPAA